MRSIAILCTALAVGCNGTTGSDLVTFSARAGGVAGVTAGFKSNKGYDIALTKARLHFGAVYLNLSVPASGAGEVPCVLPGTYAGQAFGPCDGSVCGSDVDLLSPALTTFTKTAQGIADTAAEAEVWLTSGDVNATTDLTPVLTIAGTASLATQDFPFSATLTIGPNHTPPPPNVAMPGANPICLQRIVTPIRLLPGIALQNGGTLDLRIDVTGMLDNVDFNQLTAGSDGKYVIPDEAGGIGGEFFKSVTSTDAYLFSFRK